MSRRIVLVVMCVAYFLVLLDVTIVNVALPRIGSSLHSGVSGLQWVVDGYAIALAALMLSGGTVGDLHGHKRVVLSGLALFGAASLGCGLSPSTSVLIGFRAVQGAGAALMLPGTLAVISRAYDGPEQARAIGVWAAIGSAALPAGPLLGGLLTETVGWRAIFFVNVPVVAAAIVVASRTVHESVEPQRRRVDLAGLGSGMGFLAILTFALIQAGHNGLDPEVALALVVAALLAVAFVAVERRLEHPMLPLALFRRPAFCASNSVAGAMNLSTLGLLFVLTLYLQDVRHQSALAAGLALLPLFLPLSLIAPIAGRITGRAGAKLPMTAGLLIAAAGMALVALVGSRSSYLTLLPALLLWGVGLGILTPAVVAAAIGSVPGARAGLASAVNNTARQAGGAIGIAAFGSLAGAPSSGGFVSGFQDVALVGAGLLLAGALATVSLIPGGARPRRFARGGAARRPEARSSRRPARRTSG